MGYPITAAVEIVLKAMLGGIFVLVFALFTKMLAPKRFAGIFYAAPSVALASLLMTVAFKAQWIRGALVSAWWLALWISSFTVWWRRRRCAGSGRCAARRWHWPRGGGCGGDVPVVASVPAGKATVVMHASAGRSSRSRPPLQLNQARCGKPRPRPPPFGSHSVLAPRPWLAF